MVDSYENEDLEEKLRERERNFNDISVIADGTGKIMCRSTSELFRLLGFNENATTLEQLIDPCPFLDKKEKAKILEPTEKKEYDVKYIKINNIELHPHFFTRRLENGWLQFYVRDETNITLEKRKQQEEKEKNKEHYVDVLDLISHEIKNPFLNIIARARLVQDYCKKKNFHDMQLEESLKVIENEGVRGERSLDNIIKTETKGLLYGMEIFDMLDVIEEVLSYDEIARPILKKQIEIQHSKSIPPGEAIVFGNEEKFKLIYRNLFINAERHTPARKRITYGVDVYDNYYEFSVFNEGEPIDEKMMEEYFKRGVKDEESKGKGYGLYYVKKTIEKEYEGKIWFVKDKKDGVEVRFTIPKPPKELIEKFMKEKKEE